MGIPSPGVETLRPTHPQDATAQPDATRYGLASNKLCRRVKERKPLL